MEELVDKVLKVISNIPDPASLVKVIEKIQESNDSLKMDEAKQKLIIDFLNKQPEKKGIFNDSVILRSVSPCAECEADINSGYFKIILASHSGPADSKTIHVEQQVVISFEALHNMMNHKIPDNYVVAANENFGELEQENLNKNPRDQVSQQDLEKMIEKYSLQVLDLKLSKMMTK